jgi:hypothetical protein
MDIKRILFIKFSNDEWVLTGGDYSGLTWLSDTPKPTEAELEALWPTVQYEVAYEQVEQVRKAEYQKTADPLFFKYQAGSATKEEWEAERQRIKDLYPYPEKMVES